MDQKTANILKIRLGDEDYQKLVGINNSTLHQFIAEYIKLCNPDEVFVSTDSAEDTQRIRQAAIRDGEERELAIKGHTVHFDGYRDQARDEKNTKFLLPKGVDLGPNISSIDKEEGLEEIRAFLKNIMRGHRLYVQFFCLGPTNSEFSIPAVQLTDSSYVAHSQNLLYRLGYKEFKKLGDSGSFFKFVHSQGELEKGVSKNIDRRRVYINIGEDIIYSVNTQYGGNTLGHKKLAMRLAINRASKEYWLTEHMFLMGVHGPGGRATYFTGAFPSLCGKTSTAMLEGETIVGDDIVYLREKGGQIRAVNVEKGIFGIIKGVNSKDDPIIWKAFQSTGEVIFSNVLVTEEKEVCWIGKDGEVPKNGINHSGQWSPGKKDSQGNEIPPSHPNARFTLDMKLLGNLDPELDNPEGVVVGGIVYGGRDSDTWVPVEESFDWKHGVITKGASLESETTAAALGREGVRKFNPMANLVFLSISIGRYIENHLSFGAKLKNPPPIFSVNYFLKDAQGRFLNDMADKKVWLKWMELRSHKEAGAREAPTGFVPEHEDLKRLFKEVLKKDYSKEDYIKQFTIRVPAHLAKMDRIIEIYRTKVPDTPQIVFETLEAQRQRLKEARERCGDYISPDKY
ncbi:phosphoenolpyruvate carboxykinase (GTP) [bacterium]|nr:phosphoenolpyruvate carboxykinase (GTP) [bacterium]